MLKELHKAYKINGYEFIDYIVNKSIRQIDHQQLEFVNIFEKEYPNIQNFGWSLHNCTSLVYQSHDQNGRNSFVPLDFKIIIENENRNFLTPKKGFTYFNDRFGNSEEFCNSLEKLIEIGSRLKNYGIYKFSRSSFHDILKIDCDINKMFDLIIPNNNISFGIKRCGNFCLLYADNNTKIFYFKIQ